MILYFSSLCIGALLARARILRLQCKSYAEYRYVKENYKLFGASIIKYNNKPIGECEVACLSEPECKSLNSNGSNCELNNKTISDDTDHCKESKDQNLATDAGVNSRNCTLFQEAGWVFKSTDYAFPLVGPNCKNVNPCQEEDLCMDSCQCPGYECIHCSKISNFRCPGPCRSGPCLPQNTELCIDGETENTYTCKCRPGYTGRMCEINIDECVPDPCINGQCRDDINDYKCVCNQGYTGKTCDRVIPGFCTLRCENGGSCELEKGIPYCKCKPGFTGVLCQTK